MRLYEQIKDDHQFCTYSNSDEQKAWCSCGADFTWEHREKEHEHHIAAEFERALRKQIATEIRATFSDPERLRPRDPEGKFATDLLNDWQWAARIAEEGTTK